jgi:heptosyltransferase-2
MRTLSPRNIWISPHAPAADSSWRVPLLLWLIKQLFWRSAVLIGAASERLSMIFDRRLHIDRTLPLPRREWAAYCELRHNTALPEFAPSPAFITAISDVRHQPPAFDLVIHPGASAWNRIWPHEKYPVLLAALPAHWTIAFVGLPADLAAVQAAFPPGLSENYTFLVGSLQHALQIIASARRLLVMNSGTMHFAEVLGIPTVAIFGQQTPSDVIGEGNIVPVYQVSAPCQPCGRATCNQPHLYCLTNLDPLIVARQLTQLAPA